MRRAPRRRAVAGLTLLAMTALAGATDHAGAAPDLTMNAEIRLNQALEAIRDRYRVPGLAVAVVHQGAVIYAHGFGVRRLGSADPVDADTVFHTASLSKPVTATAVLQLAESGRLDLDAPVARHLPAFAGTGITPRHLLTHSSGLPDRAGGGLLARFRAPDSLADQVRRLGQQAERPAGLDGRARKPAPFAYSDGNYAVLGALVARLHDTDFAAAMRAAVFQPLGLRDTSYRLEAIAPGRRAVPHRGRVYIRPSDDHPFDPALAPAAGLQASVRDLALFARAHLERDAALLSLPGYEVMHRGQTDTDWGSLRMALGWQRVPPGRTLQHGGEEPGFAGLIWLEPDSRLGVVVLANGNTVPRWHIRDTVRAVLADQPLPQSEPPFKVAHPWAFAGLMSLALALLLGLPVWVLRRP